MRVLIIRPRCLFNRVKKKDEVEEKGEKLEEEEEKKKRRRRRRDFLCRLDNSTEKSKNA